MRNNEVLKYFCPLSVYAHVIENENESQISLPKIIFLMNTSAGAKSPHTCQKLFGYRHLNYI